MQWLTNFVVVRWLEQKYSQLQIVINLIDESQTLTDLKGFKQDQVRKVHFEKLSLLCQQNSSFSCKSFIITTLFKAYSDLLSITKHVVKLYLLVFKNV